MPESNEIDRETMPFVAPCRKLSVLAPFRWIRLGVRDLLRAPQQSLVYGLVVAALIAIVSLLALYQGSQWIMYALLGGFVFLAPLTCIGLYAISAQLERGQQPELARSLRAAFRRHFGNEMIFALVLLVIFLVWARAAVMVTVFFPTDGTPTLEELSAFLAFGSLIGAVFAAITFSASAFSLPMLIWLGVIVFGLVLGVLTAFIGLVVIIPVIGYAVWHGYLDTIDAEAFPRHEVGITATPRIDVEDI